MPAKKRFVSHTKPANWPPVYIGKESDKHLEEGEDVSLLDFKAIQYTCKGKAVATKEQLARLQNVPKREFMRRGGQSAHAGKDLQAGTCENHQNGGVLEGVGGV